MEQINFKNETFPLRELKFPFGMMLISTENLNEKIMEGNGMYTSEEARIIDESIFYYVDDKWISLEESELCSKILLEI